MPRCTGPRNRGATPSSPVEWTHPLMPEPLRLAFLGCGFITRVHSRNLRRLGRRHIVASYASRDRAKAEAYCRQYGGDASYGDYEAAIADPRVDAVLVAVP